MMNFDGTMTVGEIATALPASMRLFERLGIDYCCGGSRALAVACARKGLALDAVVADLRALDAAPRPAARDWSKATLTELVAHIVDAHHAFTRSELERAMSLARKVAHAHGAAHPEVLPALDTLAALRDELLPHLEREEAMLFPYIRALDATGRAPRAPFPTVRAPVRVMDLQHEAAGDLLAELRAQTSNYALPPGACATWRALWASLESIERDLHEHVHLETNVLFPRAIEAEARAASRA